MIPSPRVSSVFAPYRIGWRTACSFLVPLATILFWGCMICTRRYHLLILLWMTSQLRAIIQQSMSDPAQCINAPVAVGYGAGSAGNTFVHVDGSQSGDVSNHQTSGDKFAAFLGDLGCWQFRGTTWAGLGMNICRQLLPTVGRFAICRRSNTCLFGSGGDGLARSTSTSYPRTIMGMWSIRTNYIWMFCLPTLDPIGRLKNLSGTVHL